MLGQNALYRRRASSSAARLVVAMTVVAFAAAACGSGAKVPTASTSAGGSADLGTLKVIVSNRYDMGEPGVDAALEYKLWDGTGLTVSQIVGEQGAQALATGDADISIGSPNRVIGAIKLGLAAKMVGPTISAWDQYFIVGKTSKATTPAELKGAKFGVSTFGSAGDYSVSKLAAKEGWSKSDYSVVTLGSLKGLIAGLQKGTIDAFAWSAIPAYTAQVKGYGRVIGSVRDFAPASPLVVVTVSASAIKDRPKAVKAFCTGFYQAQAKLKADPGATENLFVKWGADRTVTRDALQTELPLLSTQGGFTDALISGMADTARYTTTSAKDITDQEVKDMTVKCESL